jgi:eukaryotic-like serine/threonine-protein kinase
VQLALGGLDLQGGRPAEALDRLRQALAAQERITGPTDPLLPSYLTATATAYLALKEPRQALPLLDRASALLEKGSSPESARAETHFALARALWDGGEDRARARQLAARAREGARARPKVYAKLLAEIGAWLAAHGGADLARSSQ